jgi:osmotically-inducible protein OsmY
MTLKLALKHHRPALLAATLALASLTSACVPLLVGGAAMGGAMVATDRRTTAMQLEDKTIEVKAARRITELVGDKHHVNVNSYNRQVLLTGEVFQDGDRDTVAQAVAKVENVKNVVNETVKDWPSSVSARSNDQLIETKVKATFVDAKGLPANAFSIVVEREVVYLMGRVTEAEATQAVDLTRTIAGVKKVVKVLEIVSPAEVAPANLR